MTNRGNALFRGISIEINSCKGEGYEKRKEKG